MRQAPRAGEVALIQIMMLLAGVAGALRGALALLFLAIVACAPTPARGEGPAIWRVADADTEIWLFGTVHVLPPEVQWRTPRIDAAFNSADTVVFETDIGEAGRAQLQQLYLERGFDRSGETLARKLPPADRVRLSRVAQELGVSEAALATMRPWFAAMQLSLRFVIQKGQGINSGVERILDAEATRQGKRRLYLETAEQQIGFLADLSPEAETQFLIASLRQIEEEEDTIPEMDAAWARGDTERLSRLLNGLIEEAGPDVRDALIVQRNRRWADRIDAMLRDHEGKIFIAVGTAHLVGGDSVVAQLRARRRTVEGP